MLHRSKVKLKRVSHSAALFAKHERFSRAKLRATSVLAVTEFRRLQQLYQVLRRSLLQTDVSVYFGNKDRKGEALHQLVSSEIFTSVSVLNKITFRKF